MGTTSYNPKPSSAISKYGMPKKSDQPNTDINKIDIEIGK